MRILNFPKKFVTRLIWAYQLTISPDHSRFLKGKYPYGYCKFYPSCSQYTKEAVEKHGVFKGSFLGIKRIIKCNPWVEPKVDKLS